MTHLTKVRFSNLQKVLYPMIEATKKEVITHYIQVARATNSNLIVSERTQTKKPDTILIDYPQNARGRTLICPYSLRGVPGAPISTPLDWSELTHNLSNPNVHSFKSHTTTPWKHIWDGCYKLPGE